MEKTTVVIGEEVPRLALRTSLPGVDFGVRCRLSYNRANSEPESAESKPPSSRERKVMRHQKLVLLVILLLALGLASGVFAAEPEKGKAPPAKSLTCWYP